MRKQNLSYFLSVAAAVFVMGCAGQPEKPVVNSATESKQVLIPDPKVSVSAVDMPVRKLIKSVCVANGLSCDFSGEPSDRYQVTFSYDGDVEGLLTTIHQQTGVLYTSKNGVISLSNKDEITLYENPLKKSQCDDKTITISFKDTPAQDAFKYFYDNFGYSFSFDLRYTTISPSRQSNIQVPLLPGQQVSMPVLSDKSQAGAKTSKKDIKTVSFYYNGCDPKEAFSSFLKSQDFVSIETKDKEFSIKDYEFAMVNKSVYYDYALSPGGQSGGGSTSTGSTGSTTASSSAGATPSSGSKTTVGIDEKHRATIESYFQKYLSADGKLDLSNRGYVIIEDRPSYVQTIKKIIKKEIENSAPLSISVNIVRVDLKDNYKAGVDWNAVWTKGLFGLRDLRISSSMSGMVNGGFMVSGAFKGTDQILSILQEYGKTKIERNRTVNARSGYLESFKATKPVPYISTTSTISGTSGLAQGAITPIFEEEGVVLNMFPNIDTETKIVDIGIDVSVSEYIGDKLFDQGTQGIYALPIITKDEAKFAGQVKLGHTVILTGFKVHKAGNNKKGIPWLSQIPVAGALFGYQDDTDDTSEILIILKVEKGV